jgi:predicted nucleotide-binding protein
MARGKDKKWNSFQEAVAEVYDADDNPQRLGLMTTLNIVGPQHCPSPPWDPQGVYRVAKVGQIPVIQKLSGSAWVEADIHPPASFPPSPSMTPDAKKVFIIHGRNVAARVAVEHFLMALGLQPIDFDQLAADQGGTAFVGDIVRAGLEQAKGIVALFTPDEFAALRPDHRGAHDQGTEIQRWQARPNVIFEAGMAYGMAPKQTVLVTVGSEVSLFSDVAGVHILRLNNTTDSRGKFRQKLIGMGCDVDQRTNAWTDPARAGDFDACIAQLRGVSPRDPF